MNFEIKDQSVLKKILWLDFALGASTGVAGIFLYRLADAWLGLPMIFILWVSIITTTYSLVALRLALMKNIYIPLVKGLIAANWIWALISLYFIYLHFEQATVFGQIFLILQIVVVGGLAYLEGRQVVKIED